MDWAIDHVRDGGWILVDNVLWWGDVVSVAAGTQTILTPFASTNSMRT